MLTRALCCTLSGTIGRTISSRSSSMLDMEYQNCWKYRCTRGCSSYLVIVLNVQLPNCCAEMVIIRVSTLLFYLRYGVCSPLGGGSE